METHRKKNINLTKSVIKEKSDKTVEQQTAKANKKAYQQAYGFMERGMEEKGPTFLSDIIVKSLPGALQEWENIFIFFSVFSNVSHVFRGF